MQTLPAGAELRAAPRFTLLIRAAKLIADGREFLCIIRDASATGLKPKLNSAGGTRRERELVSI